MESCCLVILLQFKSSSIYITENGSGPAKLSAILLLRVYSVDHSGPLYSGDYSGDYSRTILVYFPIL